MRKAIALVLLFPLAYAPLVAQSLREEASIINHIERQTPGEGVVQVRQSEAISNLIGRRQVGENRETVTIDGYRVQLFSGNQQNKSKEEAFAKERRVHTLFPELATFVTFRSPSWRLRVGNFRSYEDADQVMRRIKRALPDMGREMYVVRDEIKLEL